MIPLTLGEVAKAVGGRLAGASPETPVTGVCTDTRKIAAGDLFVPLMAARDGHDFIPAARAAGAAAVLSSRQEETGATVFVKDTFEALCGIATEVRRRSGVKLTALTGSVGKTTTKEMTAAVLSGAFTTRKTEANLNNTLGVPLTLLSLTKEDQAAVVEMGMNHFGEISTCTRTAQPDLAVITNVGTAHIEFLGSREGIAKAKLEICEGLADGSPILLNGDEPLLRDRPETARLRPVYFGLDNADCGLRAEKIELGDDRTEFDVVYPGGRIHIKLGDGGRHFVYDALAAFGVGLEYGMDPAKIAEQLGEFRSGRQHILTEYGYTIIEDCYNANPESMAAALEVLASRRTSGRRIAVLGDMLELGAHSAEAHRALGEKAAACADAVFLYGGECRAALESAGGVARLFATHEELASALSRFALPGDLLLFKGSRGMKMEHVLALFLEAAGK